MAPVTTAADIMHAAPTCIAEYESLAIAARRMRDLGVGALPICGEDDRLHGMLTDRDIVTKCVAAGTDPKKVTAGELAQHTVHHVAATDSVEHMLAVMEQHQIRRLPVIDGNHRLVGIVSEADIARRLPGSATAQFVRAICAQQAIGSH